MRAMNAMKRRHSTMLSVVLGFVGAGMTGACGGGPSQSACPAPSVDPPAVEPTSCPAPVEEPCMRYRIQLDGNPSTNPALRAAYSAKFGSACYVSEANTFDCFYKDPYEACDAGLLVPTVFGAAAHNDSYKCLPVAGTENYWRQVGSDPAIKIDIIFDKAPRQTPLVEVDGMLVEVNGPYRSLMEPPTLGPGQPFRECPSGVVGADGNAVDLRDLILQVNRKAHGGAIHSDLAGFKWECTVLNANCEEVVTECEEPLVLHDPDDETAPFHPGSIGRVHHVIPMKDKRSCAWGTNSTRNAAVISDALNTWLSNKNPPADEVKQLNSAKAYTP